MTVERVWDNCLKTRIYKGAAKVVGNLNIGQSFSKNQQIAIVNSSYCDSHLFSESTNQQKEKVRLNNISKTDHNYASFT